jgi:hypothetical protein
MKKEEITQFTENSFKRIAKYFRKAISDFDLEDIRQFRTEIKKLKVFLHLLNMESEDGFSFRITKRMKTIYGYLGIVQNFQQLQKANKHVKDLFGNVPLCYVQMIEKELEYWKKLSKDFIDDGYSFMNDKQEIIAILPERLNKKSIQKFVYYTVYELNAFAGRTDDEALDSIRKFIEDIYYNYEFISPFFDEQQQHLFNKKTIDTCLTLFEDFRNQCVALILLQTFDDKLDEKEKELLKEMENEWLKKKNDLKNKLIAALDSMNIKQ